MSPIDTHVFRSKDIAPILFEWDGDVMIPVSGQKKRCDRQYVVHERYLLAPESEASDVSRRHYFACIREGWMNLPDAQRERFPTPEHLRKWCLIKCGYCHERQIVCEDEERATELVDFIAPMDEYAIATQTGPIVTVWTAKSQKKSAMKGKGEFQDSKQRVLETIADLIGISVDDLASNAARAA